MSRQGLLCYAAEDIPRNQWFIAELIRCAESEGCTLRLCTADTAFSAEQLPPLVLNRSRSADFAALCEETPGVCVYNSADVTRITNDKYRTHCFLRAHGIPTADTWLVRPGDAIPALPLPLVAKPPDGHGGAGVELLTDERALFHAARTRKRPFLLQRPMVFGWDMRVYVLGGEIYAAMLRRSERDFRSNFSLGGTAEQVQPDAEIRALVQQVQTALFAALPVSIFSGTPTAPALSGRSRMPSAAGCSMRTRTETPRAT